MQVKETLTRTLTVGTATPAKARETDLFVPSDAQRAFLRVLLEQTAEELDLDRAAEASCAVKKLPEWRLIPGFVRWVEKHVEASLRLDLTMLRRKLVARALREVADSGCEKPVALPIVARLFPVARGKKGEDQDVQVRVTAAELFAQLRSGAGAAVEIDAKGEVIDGD